MAPLSSDGNTGILLFIAVGQIAYLVFQYARLSTPPAGGLPVKVVHVSLFLALGWAIYSASWTLLALAMGQPVSSLPYGLYFVLGGFALIGAINTRNAAVGGFVGGSVPLATLSLYFLSINQAWQAMAPPLAWFGMFMIYGGLLGALTGPATISLVQAAMLHLPVKYVDRRHKGHLHDQAKNGYDVFLSHNSKDKPTVRILARALEERGLRVWLDEEQLPPGRAWQSEIENIIQTTHSAAVLVGKDGLGPWEIPEMNACLSQFVKRNMPVIPVLLPDAPLRPELPLFLQELTWVDLRSGISLAGLNRLEWGITGVKPEDRP
jgi:hypothetical protein